VLDRTIEWRRGSGAALEVGCSIGVFSRLLADRFDEVTAVDISSEAIAAARSQNITAPNLTFLREDVRQLRLGRTFDVLFCAEVLYYLPRRAAPAVCNVLDRHLAEDGVIVLVSGQVVGGESYLHFDNWKSLLQARFAELFDEVVHDPSRPYEITIFAKSGLVRTARVPAFGRHA
jgi:2-polyprenyl-3-methyl-5-hydroxy-6-metoxy-1,4-benzoquinol methylase